jgi:hypothetical protein
MLVRLMYASRATEIIRHEVLSAILKKSTSKNPSAGITGVLCFSGEIFLQVLEGGRLPVSRLYSRIAQDPRHTDVALLSFEEIEERNFSCWTMGQVNINRLNPALLLKYSEMATLDPYSVSGKVSMAMLTELVATASVVSNS